MDTFEIKLEMYWTWCGYIILERLLATALSSGFRCCFWNRDQGVIHSGKLFSRNNNSSEQVNFLLNRTSLDFLKLSLIPIAYFMTLFINKSLS